MIGATKRGTRRRRMISSKSSHPLGHADALSVARSVDNQPARSASNSPVQGIARRATTRVGPQVKLIILIPCYNEQETLPVTINDLPRDVSGFDQVEWLVVDDGSDDETSAIAVAGGVDHVIKHTRNRGLAHAFTTGLEACLQLGADVIVCTDADNQYCAADIPLLTEPILSGNADMVIGARPILDIAHFSFAKKALQRIGSRVVRFTSNTDVADAPSGFRAISRAAAQRFVVFSDYTYTLETIIQAGQNDMQIRSVPIRVNPDLRPSRLMKSIPSYLAHSILTIIRIFIIYRPARFFGVIAAALFGAGLLIGVRFLYYYFSGHGTGHIQSLILAGALLTMGFQTFLVSFIADLIAANRKLLEDIRYKQRQ
jgi:glycosyltransferase involved in cell wall biosynthesis